MAKNVLDRYRSQRTEREVAAAELKCRAAEYEAQRDRLKSWTEELFAARDEHYDPNALHFELPQIPIPDVRDTTASGPCTYAIRACVDRTRYGVSMYSLTLMQIFVDRLDRDTGEPIAVAATSDVLRTDQKLPDLSPTSKMLEDRLNEYEVTLDLIAQQPSRAPVV